MLSTMTSCTIPSTRSPSHFTTLSELSTFLYKLCDTCIAFLLPSPRSQSIHDPSLRKCGGSVCAGMRVLILAAEIVHGCASVSQSHILRAHQGSWQSLRRYCGDIRGIWQCHRVTATLSPAAAHNCPCLCTQAPEHLTTGLLGLFTWRRGLGESKGTLS